MNKMNELCEMELTGRYEEKLSALKAEISAADEYIRQDNSVTRRNLRTDMSA